MGISGDTIVVGADSDDEVETAAPARKLPSFFNLLDDDDDDNEATPVVTNANDAADRAFQLQIERTKRASLGSAVAGTASVSMFMAPMGTPISATR